MELFSNALTLGFDEQQMLNFQLVFLKKEINRTEKKSKGTK